MKQTVERLPLRVQRSLDLGGVPVDHRPSVPLQHLDRGVGINRPSRPYRHTEALDLRHRAKARAHGHGQGAFSTWESCVEGGFIIA